MSQNLQKLFSLGVWEAFNLLNRPTKINIGNVHTFYVIVYNAHCFVSICVSDCISVVNTFNCLYMYIITLFQLIRFEIYLWHSLFFKRNLITQPGWHTVNVSSFYIPLPTLFCLYRINVGKESLGWTLYNKIVHYGSHVGFCSYFQMGVSFLYNIL